MESLQHICNSARTSLLHQYIALKKLVRYVCILNRRYNQFLCLRLFNELSKRYCIYFLLEKDIFHVCHFLELTAFDLNNSDILRLRNFTAQITV